MLLPNYTTIATEVDARRNNLYTDRIKDYFTLQVAQRRILYPELTYDIYDHLSKVLDKISAYFRAHQSIAPNKYKDIQRRLHYYLTVLIFYELCNIMLILENIPFNPRDPRLRTKKNQTNLTYTHFVQEIQYTITKWVEFYPLPRQPSGLRFTSVADYMAVFMHGLETYANFRVASTVFPETSASRQKVYLNRLSIEQLFHLIETMKSQILPKLNLQFSLNDPKTPDVEQKLLTVFSNFLKQNTYETLEQLVYPWYFITKRITEWEDAWIGLSPNKLTPMCQQRLADANAHYKDLTDFLIHECSVLTTTPEPLKLYRETLQKKLFAEFGYYTPTEAWNIHNDRTIDCPDMFRDKAFYDFFTIWADDMSYERSSNALFWSSYFRVEFQNEPGIFLGVQQDLLQTCLNQLANLNPPLFVPTEPGSDRVQINRHYTPPPDIVQFIDPEMKRLKKYDPTKPNARENYYTSTAFKSLLLQFVGGLLTRCMLAGMELPFKLSYYTLGFLANPAGKNDEQRTLYYFLDLPTKSAETFGILKLAEPEFAHLYLNYNNPYPISQEDPAFDPKQQPPNPKRTPRKKETQKTFGSPKNPELTIANAEDFVHRTAAYVLTTLSPSDPAVIPEADRAKYKRVREKNRKLLKAFRSGFYIRPEGISTNETIAVHVLDKLFNDGGISPERHAAWMQSTPPIVVYSTTNTDPTTTTPEQRQYLNAIYPHQWRVADIFLNDILNDPRVPLPFDKIEGFDALIAGKSPNDIQKIKKSFYYKSFLPNLLYFWSSSRTIHPTQRYTVSFLINDPADPNDPHALARLPMSHTCFYTLDLPTFFASTDRIAIRDALLEKLVIALYKNVGFGVAGGGWRS